MDPEDEVVPTQGVATPVRARRLTNTGTGQTISVPESEVYSYLGRRNSLGEQQWHTDTGTSVGFFRDPHTGESRRRTYTDEEVAQRAALLPEENNLEVTGDVRTEAVNATEVRRARRRFADDQNALAFGQNFAQAVTLGGVGLAEHALAGDEAGEAAEMLEAANPVASAAGTLSGLAATLVTPGAIAGAAGRGANVTARGLLGFSSRLGQRATAALGGGRAARVVGQGVRAAALDVPLSLQFQAADLTDSNKPFSAEAIAANVGTDVLWGLALEAALPVVGTGIAAAARFSPTGVALRAAEHVFGPQASHLVRRIARSPAGRFLGGRRLRSASRTAGEAVADLERFNVSDLARMSSEESEALVRRVATREEARAGGAAANGDWLRLVEDPGAVRRSSEGLTRGASRMARPVRDIAFSVADRAATRSLISDSIGRASVDYTQASALANRRAEQTLFEMGESLLGRDVPQSVTNAISEARVGLATADPQQTARIVQDLRAELVATSRGGDAGSAMGAQGGRHLDSFLTDESIWGSAANNHSSAIRFMEDLTTIRESGIAELPSKPATLRQGLVSSVGGDASTSSQLRSVTRSLEDFMMRAEASGIPVAPKFRKSVANLSQAVIDTKQSIDLTEAVNRVRGAQEASGSLGNSFGFASAASALLDKAEAAMSSFLTNKNLLSNITDARKAIASSIESGVHPVVPATGVFAYRSMSDSQKRDAFSSIQKGLESVVSNPDNLMTSLEPTLDSLSQTDPDMGDNLGRVATTQIMYLAENMPRTPTSLFGDTSSQTPQTDIDVFLERFGALQDPTSILFALAEGTLTEESAEAVRIVYPELFMEMQVQTVEEFAEARARGLEEIPYSTKVASTFLLGNGIDPTLDSEFILQMQDSSAQTQAQEEVLRGPAQSQREPGFSQNAMTVTARLENV